MNHKSYYWFRLALIAAVLVAAVFSLTRHPDHTTQAQTGGTLGYGSKVYGTISAAAPLVTYSFSGTSGDFVAVTADTWTGTLDLMIDLVAPNGLVLSSSTQNTPGGDPAGAYLSVFLPDTGVYLLRLSGGNATSGDFLLTLMGRGPATATPLVYGQAVDVTIAQAAAPQFFSFETEDCPTTLVVSNPGQGQPFTFPFVVKVRDQRGQNVALLRGGEQLEDWVTVQADSGRYEVEVLAADPSLAGSIRLLVTCSGDNPGCPAGQAGIAGIPGADCTPCPSPVDWFVPGGGCPDLHLSAQQGMPTADATTVFWDAMPGADGYSVRVTGITTDGGEVYLTHADWVPGDPTQFSWILPVEGYSGYLFTLEVVVDGTVLCSQQVPINVEPTSADCPDLGLTGSVTDEATNAVALSWDASLGADQFALDMYAIIGAGEEYGGRIVIPGGTSGRSFDHFPPHLDGVRFVLWMTRGGALCSDEITIMFDGIPGQQVTCAEFSLSVAASSSSQVDLVWSEYPGADGYVYNLMDESGSPVPGHSVIMAATQLNLVLLSPPLAPGTYTASIGPWDDTAGGFCVQQVTFTFGSPNDVPCAIFSPQGGAAVHVGPGRGRAVFGFLEAGVEYRVVGQALDDAGNPWWQVDKAQFPGSEDVISLWVMQSDVSTLGVCTDVPPVEPPPVIPGDDNPPGTWGPCGSCDTCGFPASECVTSPEGECLWDPATCRNAPPPGDDGGGDCYRLGTAVDPGGSGSVSASATNCDGGYTPGTVVQVSVSVADPKNTHFVNWSGCGAGGDANPVSITMNGSCTITAHIAPW